MFSIFLVYDSGKRYILPMEILEKHISKKTLEKIKVEALKEVQRIA